MKVAAVKELVHYIATTIPLLRIACNDTKRDFAQVAHTVSICTAPITDILFIDFVGHIAFSQVLAYLV